MDTKKNNHTDPICFCCFDSDFRWYFQWTFLKIKNKNVGKIKKTLKNVKKRALNKKRFLHLWCGGWVSTNRRPLSNSANDGRTTNNGWGTDPTPPHTDRSHFTYTILLLFILLFLLMRNSWCCQSIPAYPSSSVRFLIPSMGPIIALPSMLSCGSFMACPKYLFISGSL